MAAKEIHCTFWCQSVINVFIFVLEWVVEVFGINCVSNAGRKLVIVRGVAEHYYCFLTPNTTANHAIINLPEPCCRLLATICS